MQCRNLAVLTISLLAVITIPAGVPAAAATKAITTTGLALLSGSVPVTTAVTGSVITLSAAVSAGTSPVTQGQVKFCDATYPYCTDIHLLGVAQLTKNGHATLRFRPGRGSHSYKAIFAGTHLGAASASAVHALTITGLSPSNTQISVAGWVPNYSLTASVNGISSEASAASPTGSVSFLDMTNHSTVATVPVPASTPSLAFSAPTVLPVSNEGYAAVTADFNGDGIPDLAVTDTSGGQAELSILLGKGDGTFRPLAAHPNAGPRPFEMVTGDFNGDGIVDLAVTSPLEGYIYTLLGRGDGTFIAGAKLYVLSLSSPVVADFNNDGIADIGVISNGSLQLFAGNGNGTFQTAVTVPGVTTATLIAAADFNGDGAADLAVITSGSAPSAVILSGKGDLTFVKSGSTPYIGNSPGALAVADLNGDGKLDLAVANYGSDFSGDPLTLFFGNGNGTLRPASTLSAPVGNVLSLAVADFNGDGIADLAVGLSWGPLFVVLPGTGGGRFGTAVKVDGGDYLSGSLAIGDWNGDGVPDIASPGTDGAVAAILAQPTRTSTATLNPVVLHGPGPHQIVARYSGDSHYAGSASSAASLDVEVDVPTFSLKSGSYTSLQTLAITDPTPGAQIYYQVFDANGITAYQLYKAPIPLSTPGSVNVNAYATETGYLPNKTAYAQYIINLPLAAQPVISLASGAYARAQTVSIKDATPGAAIYYTTDGSYPSTHSARYTRPITVSNSETLVASAIAYGYSMSPPARAQYILTSTPASLLYTIAGNGVGGLSGDGGLATHAQINYPQFTTVDNAGNLYFSDSNNNVVRKIAAGTRTISTVAGTGVPGYTGDGGPATRATLHNPLGLALDSSGDLFIVDTYNLAIRKLTLSTGILTTFAGPGSTQTAGDPGPRYPANLYYPQGLAFRAPSTLYYSDYETVKSIDTSHGAITAVAGTGQFGFTGDGGPAINATFRAPRGIALDARGNLDIADVYNNVIRSVNLASGIIQTVAGNGYGALNGGGGYTGDGGQATSAELNHPISVATDSLGSLYIADSQNQVIRKVEASTRVITTVAGSGPGNACSDLGGDGGSARADGLCYPSDIAFDHSNNLYVLESFKVREITPAHLPPTAVTAAPKFSLASGTFSTTQTLTLSDLTPGAAIYVSFNGAPVSTASPLYNGPITVTGNLTVNAIAVAPGYLPSPAVSQKYLFSVLPAATINTVAGSGVYGFSGAGGPATNAQIGTPTGVAVSKSGDLYFSDSGNNVVWKRAAQNGILSIVAGNGVWGKSGDGGQATATSLATPLGVAIDNVGNLFIAESSNNRIRKVAAATGIISTFAGNGNSGYFGGGDGGQATDAAINNPSGLAFDAYGNLYIADTLSLAVRQVSEATGIITTYAGSATYAVNGDGGPATKAGLGYPTALALDKAGNLYIALGYQGRVRRVAAGTHIISTFAGNGARGDSGDGGLATAAEVNAQGLATDAYGNLYMTESPGSIRKIDIATGIITRVAGNRYHGYSGNGGSPLLAEFSYPGGLAIDSASNFLIADTYNYAVRRITSTHAAAAPTFSLAPGTYTSAQSVIISDTTPGSVIYFTTNGTIPTATSTRYTGAIHVGTTETIKAFAIAPGDWNSPVVSAAYIIKP